MLHWQTHFSTAKHRIHANAAPSELVFVFRTNSRDDATCFGPQRDCWFLTVRLDDRRCVHESCSDQVLRELLRCWRKEQISALPGTAPHSG